MKMSNRAIHIAKAATKVIADYGLGGHCIETSALLVQSLHAAGFNEAYLLTVGVEIWNPAFLNWVNEHGVPRTDRQWESCLAVGGVAMHLGAGQDVDLGSSRWPGHLVAVVPKSFEARDGMFDLSITQVNNYAEDISLSPIVIRLEPKSSFVCGDKPIVQEICGCRLKYTAYPYDKSYANEGEGLSTQGIGKAVQQVLEIAKSFE